MIEEHLKNAQQDHQDKILRIFKKMHMSLDAAIKSLETVDFKSWGPNQGMDGSIRASTIESVLSDVRTCRGHKIYLGFINDVLLRIEADKNPSAPEDPYATSGKNKGD